MPAGGQRRPRARMERQDHRPVGRGHARPGGRSRRPSPQASGSRPDGPSPEGSRRVAAGGPASLPIAGEHPGSRTRAETRAARSSIRSPTCDDAGRDALCGQVGHRGGGRGEEPAREVVRHDAVELLGHAPVEGAQAGLDVGDRDAELGRRQGPGQGGVGVAVDQHRVRRGVAQERLQGDEHSAGLVAVAAATDPERVVRPGQAQLTEEAAGHRLVVVLAGVDEDLVVVAAQDRLQRGRLYELRSRADDADDPHRRPSPTRRRRRWAPRRLSGAAWRPGRRCRGSERSAAARSRAGCCVRPGRTSSCGKRPKSRRRHSPSAVWVTMARNGAGSPHCRAVAQQRSISSGERSGSYAAHFGAVERQPLDQRQGPRVRQLLDVPRGRSAQDEDRDVVQAAERAPRST